MDHRGNGRDNWHNDYPRQESAKPYVAFELTKDGKIPEKLFSDTAEKIALSFCDSGNRGKINSTQMRRFFNEVKRYRRVISSPEEWKKQLPYIRMIKSKVAYNIARNPMRSTQTDNLKRFIMDGIDKVKSKEDYGTFVDLFEAVYGFYYEHAPSKN